jgi:glycosyltransferase involved in cell wall biosynthesis
MRDNELIKTLKTMGHEVTMVPLYLPLSVETPEVIGDTPVFYGAINIYLKQMIPFYRKVPVWFERLLDSPKMLQWAARKSGSTNAPGLEEMTLSTLRGENGNQASELDHLISWLKKSEKPDVIHLSNALLVGLARRMKNELNVPIVCSLGDENVWIDPMDEAYREQIWQTMAERATDVDAFIAVSDYYADYMKNHMQLTDEKLHTVHTGINLNGYEPAALSFSPPTIGYLCRMAEPFGLGILIDAFIRLKKENKFQNLKLRITGGYTTDDAKFVKSVKKKLAREKVIDDVDFVGDFSIKSRKEFLKSLSVLTVPVIGGEALGTYQIEALAAGVPVVQPKVGGFPELVKITGGGIIYEPNDGNHLAEALALLLSDPKQARGLADKGRKVIFDQFGIEHMAEKMVKVYEDLVKK